MLLIFNLRTVRSPAAVPSQGTTGASHTPCFRPEDFDVWKRRLDVAAVAIEQEVEWEQGGRSVTFAIRRETASNSRRRRFGGLGVLDHRDKAKTRAAQAGAAGIQERGGLCSRQNAARQFADASGPSRGQGQG